MSKKDKWTGNGLKSIQTVPIEVKAPNGGDGIVPPTFGASVAPPSVDDIAAAKAATISSAESVRAEMAKFTPEHLGVDEEAFSAYIRPALLTLGHSVAEYVTELEQRGLGADADRIRIAFVEAMLPWPSTGRAMNVIADLGIMCRFFLPVGPTTPEVQTVLLPVTRPGGKWRRTPLTSKVRGASSILVLLRKKQEGQEKVAKAALKDELGKLQSRTTGEIEAVFETGGIGLLYVPRWQDSAGHDHDHGHLLVVVTDEKIFAEDGLGKIRWLAQRVKESGESIPVSSLGKDKLQLDHKVERADFFALVNFWRSLKEGLALRQAERQKAAPPAATDTSDTEAVTE